MLNGLDLFSGIGGISLALVPWVRPIAYCENDRHAQSVLLSRMRDKRLPMAPIWSDVRTIRKDHLLFSTDIIYGGFPCQDISVAGTGVGLEGERSGLFFEIIRLTRDIRPRFVFLENVPAITVRGLDRVLLEFTTLGYDTRWTIVSAAEMGAPHLRERWFLLAHANGPRGRNESNGEPRSSDTAKPGLHGETHTNPAGNRGIEGRPEPDAGWIPDVSIAGFGSSNSCRAGLQRWLDAKEAWKTFAIGGGGGGGAWPHWLPQPSLCRGDDGLRHRVDRLRGLGNAVVPLQAREAFQRLMGLGKPLALETIPLP